MIIQNGFVFTEDNRFAKRDIVVKNDRIAGIVPASSAVADGAGEIINALGCYVLPGFVDIHTHGAVGHDLSDSSAEGIEAMLAHHAGHGVTSVVLATLTAPQSVLEENIKTALPYFDKEGCGAVLRGINMEGPFVSMGKRGAQNPDYIMNPSLPVFDSLYELSQGRILIVAVAPELPGGISFIRQASGKCAVSLAHTEADYDQGALAFQAGASLMTHLFNGMTAFGHREPGVIGAAGDYGAYVEIISDGVHLHPSVVRAAFKWFGPERVCLISDTMRAAGMPDGTYNTGGMQVIVKDGKATLAGGNNSIAGSVVNLADMCRRAIGFGVPMEYAIRASSQNPANAAGLGHEVGSIQTGKRADFILWDHELKTRAVICGGQLLRQTNV